MPSHRIDPDFDFRSDAGGGDPDKTSPTLRRYHQMLWSKPLPNGHRFDLDTTTEWSYLHHRSDLGEYFLSSDAVLASFKDWTATKALIEQLPEDDVEHFEHIGYTIGGMMIFPSNKVDGKWTINMARGMTRSIADRMDLTLECIRRYYDGNPLTPLGPTLSRYGNFFALFEDFRGYVDFFLLEDLVTDGYDAVRFFMDFEDFSSPAVPTDVETYVQFREASIAFATTRNQRIVAWAADNLE